MVLGFGEALRAGLEQLDAREQRILLARGLRPDDAPGEPATLEQLGRGLGVTRERVRQLEQRAWRRLSSHVRVQFLNWR